MEFGNSSRPRGFYVLNADKWARAVDIPQRAWEENEKKGKQVRTSNDSSSKSITTIETDTIATSRAVHLNLAGIGLEALGRVLGL